MRAAQEFIAAGDIYQANLSRRWHLSFAIRLLRHQVYHALRRANPAPFAACVQWNGWSIFSSSPERLLRITGREISTRPIAGTRARQGSPEQDRRDTAELVAHPKERAEHVMLIDLERNDLGRVCDAGSVTVDEYMVTESYAHVHHIVSNVRGRLRADRSPVDALRALFPGGTITGCPKVRCMQIIAALEGAGRGAYTGSLGWLDTDGDADFNILIRTLTMRGDAIELRAGSRHRRGLHSGAESSKRPVPRHGVCCARSAQRPDRRRREHRARPHGSTEWPDQPLPADDRGLHYGDGVFETVLVRARRARFLDAHLARLARGMARLAIATDSLPLLRAEIDAAVAMAPPLAILKIIVTRGSAPRRGYAPQGDETPRRLVTLWPTRRPGMRRSMKA